MKKDFIIRVSLTLSYILVVVLIQQRFDSRLFPLIGGALLGFLLPYLDYFIYAVVTSPGDEVSIKAMNYLRKTKIIKALGSLYYDAGVRKELIFHTLHFYLILIAFTLWVVSSSGSWFGRGIVLAFSFHLFVVQLSEFMNFGTISWLDRYNINLDRERKTWYLVGNIVVLLFLGLFG